ncbi:signal peptidase II [Pueribacillus theae]|uniref:Lipoprotein signal peptidase n=1 Tax=Pueribacillus theae TaxID=2171751 RepID=A0A2U1K872_9BACI|nr:signal peptidase II [Pueribacillus theae]PWA13429.1 signal peptidase II [Pueribacillus theae]
MFYYLIALIVILMDQLTKWIVAAKMNIGEQIVLIENVLYFTSHRNRGAAFGILQGKMWLFFMITFIVVVGIIYYLQKHVAYKGTGIAFGLILGGAIGNFIDRFFRGEVVDFIDVKIGTRDFPIFNIADSSLVIGVILLMLFTLKEEQKKGEA